MIIEIDHAILQSIIYCYLIFGSFRYELNWNLNYKEVFMEFSNVT
jgi:hypothetical protein